MPSNADYTREYFQIIDELDGDVESRRAAFNYMQDSTAIVHHQVVASSFVPRLFNRKTYDVMKQHGRDRATASSCKVIERYRADPEYRTLVRLRPAPRRAHPAAARLRLGAAVRPRGHVPGRGRLPHQASASSTPTAASGMNENREITNSIARLRHASRAFARTTPVEGCELFESWVRRVPGHLRHLRAPRWRTRAWPSATIWRTAWSTSSTSSPSSSARRGVECVVADVRELSFDGEVLHDTRTGCASNAIWRRCVTNDVHRALGRLPGASSTPCGPQKVALIGSFAGHIVHDKQLFEVLFDAADPGASSTPTRSRSWRRPCRMTAFLDDDHVNIDADPRQPATSGSSSPPTTTAPTTCTPAAYVTSGGMGARHRPSSPTARRLPLHRAALHPPLQDRRRCRRDTRHRRGARRRAWQSEPRTVQQSERAVPVQRPRSKASSAAWGRIPRSRRTNDGHDRGHYLGRLRRARWAGAVNGIR